MTTHKQPNNGGPAFPVVHAIVPQPGHFTTTPAAMPGMTLRDYFAAAALTGLLSDPNVRYDQDAAESAYACADAMLAAREKVSR